MFKYTVYTVSTNLLPTSIFIVHRYHAHLPTELNHFVIVREDNLAPPTDASTTVCLYELSAAKKSVNSIT